MTQTFFYITVPDRAEARALGETLIRERVAACINILDGMESMYWWQGKFCRDQETVLIAKTRTELSEKLVERVKALHRYENPCIVALPIQGGYQPFLDWIDQETLQVE